MTTPLPLRRVLLMLPRTTLIMQPQAIRYPTVPSVLKALLESLVITNAIFDGAYTIEISPSGTGTGQITVNVTGDKIASAQNNQMVSGENYDADVPLPPWSNVVMAAILVFIMLQNRRKT